MHFYAHFYLLTLKLLTNSKISHKFPCLNISKTSSMELISVWLTVLITDSKLFFLLLLVKDGSVFLLHYNLFHIMMKLCLYCLKWIPNSNLLHLCYQLVLMTMSESLSPLVISRLTLINNSCLGGAVLSDLFQHWCNLIISLSLSGWVVTSLTSFRFN